MKKTYSSLLLLIILFPGLGKGQAISVNDNFEDGDFTTNPAWQGDTTNFIVIEESGNRRLRLSAPGAGSSYLSTSSVAGYGSWEFFLRFDYSTLSGSNNLTVFLISDLADLSGGLNGYALKAGESGSDDVFQIVRYDNGVETETVLSGTTNINSGGEYQVKIDRTSDGKWTLYISNGYGSALLREATGTDNTHATSGYFGFLPEYTSTRADKFFFDDIIITKSPLEVTTAVPLDNQRIQVFFTDEVDPASVDNSDFIIDNGIGSPNAAISQGNTITLTYDSVLPGGDYTLSVSNISDFSGTSIPNNSTIPLSLFDSFSAGDIVINEFMYDEPVGLAEYVEIWNTTTKRFNLAGWELGDSNTPSTISSDTLILGAHDFLVMSADTIALFDTFGSRSYKKMSSFPSLNNTSGDAIRIHTDTDILVDSLYYDQDWGGENIALERRSVTTASVFKENWGKSPHISGGTPGKANEISVDTASPSLSALQIPNSRTLNLVFNERLKSESVASVGNYSITGEPGINSARYMEPDTVRLALSSPLQNAVSYELSITEIEDIFGNTISGMDTTFTFFEISMADSGEVLINEFMPDPPTGISEYVELHNPTSQSFDLQGWTLNDNTGTKRIITSSNFVLPPDTFVVLAPDNSLLNSFPDINLLVVGNSFPSLNNSGDDIVLSNGSGIKLDSLGYESEWVGEGQSTERRASSHSASLEGNWGISPALKGGTPGTTNAIEPDLTAPLLESFRITSGSRLTLIFNERVSTESASSTNNYQFTGEISISGAKFFPPDTVVLDLQPNMQNAVSYQLSISGIEDMFSNAVSYLDTVFTYFRISEPDSGAVIMNEFLYEPPAGVTEYIEIFNRTAKSYDLANWTINDNTGSRKTILRESYVLPPNNFVVLAPDSSLIDNFPDIHLITMGGRFPSLNNSGDDIVLRSNDGRMLDSLQYNSAWGGEQVPLERRSSAISSIFQENWGESPAGTGTPGTPNAIAPDQSSPEFTDLNILTPSSLQLIFSERLDLKSVTDLSNFRISPDIGIENISVSGDTLTLLLTENLISGVTYHITVANLQDIFGNTLDSTTKSARYVEFSSSNAGDVVINEILHRGSDSAPEFVEIFNRSEKNFNLNGWQLGDNVDLADIENKVKLESGAYLVLTGTKSFAATTRNAVFLPDFPSLNDDNDAIYIRSATGLTVDSLFYDEDWDGHTGVSLERRDPSSASNDPSNWTSHTGDNKQTAGIQNSGFQPDESPPAVTFSSFFTGNLIEVRFNEFIRITPEVQFLLDNTELIVNHFDPKRGNRILLAHNGFQKSGEVPSHVLTVRNLSDVRGNITSNTTIPVAKPLKPGNVVINEIMFNPLSKPDDGQPDQGEYIELKNTGEYAISLEGFNLHDAPDENGEVRTLKPVNAEPKWIPPNDVLLVYADTTAIFSHSKTAVFFELANSHSEQSARIDRNSLSLASTSDAIYLADSTGATIDSVLYDENWHNPNLVDTRGVALERINPRGDSNDPLNWGSSTKSLGGTPASENSLLQTPDNQPINTGLSFNPNPFSPDEDGHEDHLFINYRLDQPDYLLKVRIFDRYGRLVRELTDGRPSGFEGSLIWDGNDNEGNKNRIGIYIVLFEAYNSNGGENRTFKEVVVLARKF